MLNFDHRGATGLDAAIEIALGLKARPLASDLIALEPRMVFDGAAGATLVAVKEAAGADAAADHAAAHEAASDLAADAAKLAAAVQPVDNSDVRQNLPAAAAAAPSIREIVFIDARVLNPDAFRQAVGKDVLVVTIEADQDGFDAIGKVLAQQGREISALHIIGHGTQAQATLGASVIDTASVEQHSQDLHAWQSHLTTEADIMFYGCKVAAGEEGSKLIAAIAQATAADVAASADDVGNQGGKADWTLEKTTGAIETKIIAPENYAYDLADFAVSGIPADRIVRPTNTRPVIEGTTPAGTKKIELIFTYYDAGLRKDVSFTRNATFVAESGGDVKWKVAQTTDLKNNMTYRVATRVTDSRDAVSTNTDAFQILIDTTAPKVASLVAAGRQTDNTYKVTIRFSEAIDTSTFTASDIVLPTMGGRAIGTITNLVFSADQTSVDVFFTPLAQTSGVAWLNVLPTFKDKAGNDAVDPPDYTTASTSFFFYAGPTDLMTCKLDGVLMTNVAAPLTSNPRPTLTLTTAATAASVEVYSGAERLASLTKTGTEWIWTPATDLPEGANALYLKITSAGTNPVVRYASIRITVDRTPPVAPRFNALANDIVPSTSWVLNGTTEKGSTVTVTSPTIPVLTANTNTALGTWALTVPAGLAAGRYKLQATAKDALGNVSGITELTFYVFNNDAGVAVDTVDWEPVTPAANTFIINKIDEFGVLLDGSTTDAMVTMDYKYWAVGSSEPDYDGSNLVDGINGAWEVNFVPPGEGKYFVKVMLTDTDGIAHESLFIVEADTTPPAAARIDRLVWTADSPLSGTIEQNATLVISVDENDVASSISGTKWTIAALAEGNHTIDILATDRAGNVTSSTYDVTVHAAAPYDGPSLLGMVAGSSSGHRSFTLTFDRDIDARSMIADNFLMPGSNLRPTITQGANRSVWTLTYADVSDTASAVVTFAPFVSIRDDTGLRLKSKQTIEAVTVTSDTGGAAKTISLSSTGTINDTTPAFDLVANGILASVDIYNGATKIGVATLDPGDRLHWTWTPDALADGSYAYQAKAKDLFGAVTTFDFSFSVKSAAPNGPVLSSYPQFTNTVPSFSGTAARSGTVAAYVNGEKVSTIAVDFEGKWSTTLNLLIYGERTYAVSFLTTDVNGNVSNATSVQVTVDTTRPSVTAIDRVGQEKTNATSVAFQVTFSEDVKDVTPDSFEVRDGSDALVTGARISTAPAPGGSGSRAWVVTVEDFGSSSAVQLRLKANTASTDMAGNRVLSSTKSAGYIIDRDGPALTIAAAGASSAKRPVITGTASADATSVSLYLVKDDNSRVSLGSYTPASHANDWTWSITPAVDLPDGVNRIEAVAHDAQDNPTTATTNLTVDTTGPSLTIANAGATSAKRPVITGTASADATSVSLYLVKDDNSRVSLGSYMPTSHASEWTWSITPTSDLADGLNRIEAVARDAQENPTAAVAVLDVDSTSPSVASLSAGQSENGDYIIDVSFSETIDVSTFRLTDTALVEGKGTLSVVAVEGLSATLRFTPESGYAGAVRLSATGMSFKDRHGNAARLDGATADVSFRISPVEPEPSDLTAPESQLLEGHEDNRLTGSVGATGGAGPLTYRIVSRPDNGKVTLGEGGSFSFTPDANFNGNDHFTISVGDGTTTVLQDIEVIVLPVNDAPSGALVISGQAKVGQTLKAISTLQDADGLGVLSIEWFVGNRSVGTGDEFTIGKSEAGASIRAVASYLDQQGNGEKVVSAPVVVPSGFVPPPAAPIVVTPPGNFAPIGEQPSKTETVRNDAPPAPKLSVSGQSSEAETSVIASVAEASTAIVAKPITVVAGGRMSSMIALPFTSASDAPSSLSTSSSTSGSEAGGVSAPLASTSLASRLQFSAIDRGVVLEVRISAPSPSSTDAAARVPGADIQIVSGGDAVYKLGSSIFVARGQGKVTFSAEIIDSTGARVIVPLTVDTATGDIELGPAPRSDRDYGASFAELLRRETDMRVAELLASLVAMESSARVSLGDTSAA